MDLHSLTDMPTTRTARKRLGRGRASGKGKTSGKGHKGQMARKGNKHKRAFEGGQMPLVRRIPKRGFTNPTRVEYTPVNVAALNAFSEGTEVTPEVMRAAGVAGRKEMLIKILGNGKIDRKLTVKAAAFSDSARAKIEAAGGACEVL